VFFENLIELLKIYLQFSRLIRELFCCFPYSFEPSSSSSSSSFDAKRRERTRRGDTMAR
jgi:hypothetical protein